MAAIAPPSAPAAVSTLSEDELQSELIQFLAASEAADTVEEANNIFKNIVKHPGGVAWLREVLEAQHNDNIQERLMTQGIAERLSESCEASVVLATTLTTCSVMLIVNDPVSKNGTIKFKGLFTPDMAFSDGRFQYNGAASNLGGAIDYAIVNASQIYLYRSGELIGRYIGNSIRNKIFPNQGTIEGW